MLNLAAVEYHPPAKSALYTRSANYRTRFEVMNLAGQTILSEAVTDAGMTIDISHFQQGTYFIKLVSANGASSGKKFIRLSNSISRLNITNPLYFVQQGWYFKP